MKNKSCRAVKHFVVQNLFCKKKNYYYRYYNGPTLILLSRKKNKPYVSGCDTDTKKKSMKERKTEEKSGRVIFSALPTPVLRFHEDKKNLIKDMC